jgi:hypothetical protein
MNNDVDSNNGAVSNVEYDHLTVDVALLDRAWKRALERMSDVLTTFPGKGWQSDDSYDEFRGVVENIRDLQELVFDRDLEGFEKWLNVSVYEWMMDDLRCELLPKSYEDF